MTAVRADCDENQLSVLGFLVLSWSLKGREPGNPTFRKPRNVGHPQSGASGDGNLISRENGHAVPGALPLPDCFVPESPKGIHGKCFLLCLELLETHHVRFSFR